MRDCGSAGQQVPRVQAKVEVCQTARGHWTHQLEEGDNGGPDCPSKYR